jgi:hypothetical protein
MIGDLIALLCVCGHDMSVLLRNEDEHLCILNFFDNDPLSSTFGELVRECPGCGERLGLHRLTGAPNSKVQG